MPSARHKAAVDRTTRRRLARLAVPALAATLVTATVVGISVATTEQPRPQVAAKQIPGYTATVSQSDLAEGLLDRQQSVNRSARRVTLEEKPNPVGYRFTTAPLNLRAEPRQQADVVTVLPVATKILITGETRHGFAEVVRDGRPYWVSAEFLAKEKPTPEPSPTAAASASAPAPATPSSPEAGSCTATPPSGVVADAMAVFEAVCANFPSITTYGGWRADGEHSDGRGVDVMVSGDLGWQVAEFLRAHAAQLNLYDVIYAQHIWTPERASEGWRMMEDRGSTTANHYDHVHVAVN